MADGDPDLDSSPAEAGDAQLQEVGDPRDAPRDATGTAPPDPVSVSAAPPAPQFSYGSEWRSRRSLVIAAALVGLVGLVVVQFSFILRSPGRGGEVGAPASTAASSANAASANDVAPLLEDPDPSPPPAAAVVPAESGAAGVELFQDDGDERPPGPEPRKPRPDARSSPGTVLEAAARACNTASVAGLSRQIIAQSRCINPKAFVPVPSRPNLNVKSNVFFYLDSSARDHLLKALDANRKKTMTVHSALRTVAQQYLLRRWALGKRCGIEIASPPGESNHESGLSLDIAEGPAWRAALEAERFRWLGSIDRVHFDFQGPDAASRSSIDVKAFQQLWNRNHEDDRIPESGSYTPATQQRLEKSPANGFPLGADCD
jgi:hypothetical protein